MVHAMEGPYIPFFITCMLTHSVSALSEIPYTNSLIMNEEFAVLEISLLVNESAATLHNETLTNRKILSHSKP